EGHFGGDIYATAVSGNYAYVGQGQHLVVLDISNPSQPFELGRIDTIGIVFDIKISGSYAYIVNDNEDLVIVDISDPTAPTLAGSYDTGYALGVAVSSNYAYVADDENGLVIIDISNPAAPTLAGSYDTAGYAKGVAVSGNYAYVADHHNGLVILDISNPAVPTLAGSYDTAGYAFGVAVSGSYAYVASNNGLVIVNVNNPAAPTLTGSYGIAGLTMGVVVSGSYAYVTDGNNGLVIVDISNPAAPTLAGSYDTEEYARGVAVSGNYAYVADNSGLVIIDISNPAAPTYEGSYDLAGDAQGVAVSGSYAYLADSNNGLVIIDINNPTVPTLAGSYDTAGDANGVVVSGSYAYVADGTNGLVIIDISNPAAPTLAGSYDTVGYAYGVAVSGSYAYVASSNGLVIVDVNNPAAPTLAGSYGIAGLTMGVAVSGNYAYVAGFTNGLVIVDISNPAAPTLAGSYDTAGFAENVAVSGSYAYIADGNKGLVIVDVSNPAAPTLASIYDKAGWMHDVAVSGSYAYTASSNGRTTTIINISNPAAPTLAGRYDMRGYASGVAVSGSYAYVADYHNGLVILRTNITSSSNAPVASDQSITTPEDTSVDITLSATDADGDALTYSIVDVPSHGTVTLSGNTATYTPASNYNGADRFTFKANDGTVDSNTATVSITVTGVNNVPVASDQSVTTPEDTSVDITLSATDADGDALTYSIVDVPSHGTVTLSGNTATYTPDANYNGADSFTFKANDGTVDSNTATVSMTVTGVNNIPVASDQSVTTPEDTSVDITLSATDADGDALTYSIVDVPSHGTVTLSGNTATYTPTSNYNGADRFTFKANDGTVDSNTATVSMTVTGVNNIPVASDQSVTTPEDTSVDITLSATDADGDALTYSIVDVPSHGTVTLSDNTATYTPTSNYNGADSFTFNANDGTVDSNTATVSITVTGVNNVPVASDQSVTTPEDTSVDITLSATDADGDALTYSIVDVPSHGTVTLSDNTATYTPDANYNGADSFTFNANDGTDDSNTATVSITVSAVNDAP
ncbi:MAG: tandem-95 repeat protein, partial [Methanosarcinales archaeon]|nr:tandem-95 repeat protein [Methanosarcinales archaeon]